MMDFLYLHRRREREDAGRLPGTPGHECQCTRLAWAAPSFVSEALCSFRAADMIDLPNRAWQGWLLASKREMGAAAGEGRRDGRRDMRADGGSRVWQPCAAAQL